MSEPVPERTAPKTTADRTDNTPSVRSVAVGAAAIGATVGGVALFVAGGWIVVAATTVAVAGASYAVTRARNPRPRRTGTSALAALLGRSKRGTSSGSLSWPSTGNQSKRAASKGGGRSAGGSTGRTGRVGLRTPRLPALTPKGRARAGVGRLTGPHASTSGKRPAVKAAAKPGVKPLGTKAPGTPTRTPARPAARPRLTTAPKPKPATPRTSGTRLATSKRATPKPTTGRGGAAHPYRRFTPKAKAARPPTSSTARPVRRTGTGVTSRGKKFPGMSPRRTGGGLPPTPKRLGSSVTPRRRTTGGGKATTSRARRLGTPGVRRPTLGAAKRVPNRTASRPRPFMRVPGRRLAGTALRLPKRQGWKVTRPSKTQARKARRTLTLRSRVRVRRGLAAVRRSPGWLWKHRPRVRLIPVLPGPIQQEWLKPTITPKLTTTKPRTPYPALTKRRAQPTTPEVKPMSSAPLEAATDAFASIAQFTPENERDLSSFLGGLSEMFERQAASLTTLSGRMTGEMPLASPVADAMQQLAAGVASLTDLAQDTHSTYAAAHEAERSRIENPRPGEEFWDVSRNR